MGHHNHSGSEDTMDEDLRKRRVYVLLLVFFSVIGGLLISYSIQTPNGMSTEQCKNEYAQTYSIGVYDSTITLINSFITNCSPSNVEVFVWQNKEGKTRGSLLRCLKSDGNYTYFPLEYKRKP